jgi:hypothetical protein
MFAYFAYIGELIGALAQKQGPVVYEESKNLLLTLIQKGLENDSTASIEGDTAQQVDFFIYFMHDPQIYLLILHFI